jgi:hypothetical protein
VKKYIVFLTDGLNTENRWDTDPQKIDKRTEQICDEIRRSTINVYTVRLMEGNEALLRGCATKPSMYYPVNKPSDLKDAFAEIAGELVALRLAR